MEATLPNGHAWYGPQRVAQVTAGERMEVSAGLDVIAADETETPSREAQFVG
ncbi:MAG: hypothetical protein GY722_11535 [bacterium]|nr:hypothetical protein [bacterium]